MKGFGPIAICLAAAALFAASVPLSKTLLESLQPLTLAGLLYAGSALAAGPFALRGARGAVAHTELRRLRLAGAVLLGGGLGPVLLLMALSRAPAASVALWLNLESVATALLAWAFFREHLGRATTLACGMVAAAGVLLASPGRFSAAPAGLLAALACVCWGLDNNLTSVIDDLTPAQVTFAKGLFAGLANLALGCAFERSWPGFAVVAAALGVGALSYGASIVLYIHGAQRLGAVRSQMLFATAPFVGGLLSWTFLGERLEPVQAGAAAVMAGGLAVLFLGRHGHAHAHTAVTHIHVHRHDDGHHGHPHSGAAAAPAHAHAHTHDAVVHDHPHHPDLHHRHGH